VAKILLLSSDVVSGHVGNAAARFVLQRLGHEVLALPTVILSSHLGHQPVAGTEIEAKTLSRMIDALEANGWLADIGGVLTGYLPSLAHVAVATRAVRLVKERLSPEAVVLVDPVLGDDPKGLYVDENAARAVRDELVPLAHIITPNRFELYWLSECRVDSAADAQLAARELAPPFVLATSVPGRTAAELDNVLVTAGNAMVSTVKRRPRAPHGTGDLLAALLLAHMVAGKTPARAMSLAVAGVEAVLDASRQAVELRLVASQAAWTKPRPWPVSPIGARDRP
jgi:pyridoxine kinase